MRMTIKKGDNVVVITGKEKGKTGKVLEVFPEQNRVLVDGVNIVSRHQKARNQQEKSGIVKKPAPINASNVMVVCPVCGKATRVHHKEIDGKKVRVCKCGGSLDKEFVKSTKKEAKKVAKAEVKQTKTEKAEAKPAETKVAEKKTVSKPKTETKKTTAKTEKPAEKKVASKTTEKTTSAQKSNAKTNKASK